jgi:ribosomal protein S18 acetylase RimI-like enzyme
MSPTPPPGPDRLRSASSADPAPAEPTPAVPTTSGHALPAVSIRRATIADARAIAEIAVRGWQSAYREILPAGYLDSLTVRAREIGWRHWLENSTDEMPAWVAPAEGAIAGFASAGPPRDDDLATPIAEVYAVYVDSDRQRHGIGRALMETATSHLRGLGASELVLWVFEANAPARAFYEALGWRPDGARQELVLGDAAAVEVRYRLGAR